jgi:hypothetical protein
MGHRGPNNQGSRRGTSPRSTGIRRSASRGMTIQKEIKPVAFNAQKCYKAWPGVAQRYIIKNFHLSKYC